MGTNHITGTADRLRRCQLRWIQCNKLVTVIGHQFITLTVDICVQHGRREVQRRAGLSAAAETCSSCDRTGWPLPLPSNLTCTESRWISKPNIQLNIVILSTPAAVAGRVFLSLLDTLSVKKTDAVRITELDTEMFYHEFWKTTNLGSKGQRSRSRVTKHYWRGSLHSCECWLLQVSKHTYTPPSALPGH